MNQMLSTFLVTPSTKRPSTRTKFTRRPHIKSKNGCITCKTRRIKCDESRPVCQRCQNGGFQCEGKGYEKDSSTSGVTKRNRTLQPSPANAQVTISRKREESSYLQRPILPPGQSNRDRISLHYFQNMTLQRPPLQDLAAQGPFYSDFDRLTLQLVAYEPEYHNPVWHSLCAVASFSFSFVQEETSRSPFHYQPNTLQHYNQSIHLLKNYASSDNHTVVVILVSCYLFCHLEVLLRNVPSAINHIQAGIAILRVNKRKLSSTYTIFANLFYSIILWGYIDGRIASPCGVKNEYYAYLPDMESFGGLPEAEASLWETISTGLEYARAFEELKVKDNAPRNIEEKAKRHGRILITKLKVWSENFNDLLSDPRMSNTTFMDTETVAWLNLRRKLFRIWLPQRLSIGEISYDTFVDEFEECLDMSQKIYHAMGGNGLEHVHRALMREHYMQIYMISIKCRNPTIRQRALEHSSKHLFSSAMWHWKLILLLAERVIEIEKEELSTLHDSRGETVPEERSRIHDINNVTTGKQDSELVVFQFRRKVDGKWQHREETITTNANKVPGKGLWVNT